MGSLDRRTPPPRKRQLVRSAAACVDTHGRGRASRHRARSPRRCHRVHTGKRAVHPVGAAYEATVVVEDSGWDLVEGTVLGRPGSYRAIAGLSRGFGIPLRWRDVHGIAVRMFDAGGPAIPQDLLVATAHRKSSGRDATSVTPRYEQVFSSMLRLRAPNGEVIVRASPLQPMPEDATVHTYVAGRWEFEIGVSPPGGEARPVARLTLGAPLSREATEALEFNLAHDGGGSCRSAC